MNEREKLYRLCRSKIDSGKMTKLDVLSYLWTFVETIDYKPKTKLALEQEFVYNDVIRRILNPLKNDNSRIKFASFSCRVIVYAKHIRR